MHTLLSFFGVRESLPPTSGFHTSPPPPWAFFLGEIDGPLVAFLKKSHIPPLPLPVALFPFSFGACADPPLATPIGQNPCLFFLIRCSRERLFRFPPRDQYDPFLFSFSFPYGGDFSWMTARLFPPRRGSFLFPLLHYEFFFFPTVSAHDMIHFRKNEPSFCSLSFYKEGGFSFPFPFFSPGSREMFPPPLSFPSFTKQGNSAFLRGW